MFEINVLETLFFTHILIDIYSNSFRKFIFTPNVHIPPARELWYVGMLLLQKGILTNYYNMESIALGYLVIEEDNYNMIIYFVLIRIKQKDVDMAKIGEDQQDCTFHTSREMYNLLKRFCTVRQSSEATSNHDMIFTSITHLQEEDSVS